jgi:sugar fermentation stimulation protein A
MSLSSGTVGVRFALPLVSGHFIRRLNRFAALVRVAGRDERVHVRNSGRLRELLVPGRPVLLEPAHREGRRTRFTLALVRLTGGYVSVDAHLPNALVEAGLRRGGVPGCRGYCFLRREPEMGRKRADFLLERGDTRCLVEVKSVTLVEGGVALFPDAPTARGRSHLEHLIAARGQGLEGVVLFVIQRADAIALTPNRRTDPAFAAALTRARQAGVRIRAMTCRITRAGVWLAGSVPVRFRGGGSSPVGNPHPARERG